MQYAISQIVSNVVLIVGYQADHTLGRLRRYLLAIDAAGIAFAAALGLPISSHTMPLLVPFAETAGAVPG